MSRRHAAAIIGALLLVPAAAPAQSALDRLLENARYWEARGREDKAVEAWEKVLLSQPDNADALLTLGLHHARKGETRKANEYLGRLRKAAPNHPGIAQLQQALRIGSESEDLLGKARALASKGDAKGAVAAYQQLFGGEEPSRTLAVEYYQTLAGAPGGWEAARAGLERQIARGNDGAPVRLALAQILTYRSTTRREGIRQLEELVRQPAVAAAAAQSWRQALLWLDGNAGDIPTFQRYLERHPLDNEVQARLAQVRAGAVGPAIQSGFRALEREELSEAEALFSRAGSTAEALVGKALVAMEKRDFATARALLEQVKAQRPKQPEMWEQSLRSATFWATIEEGHAARDRRDWAVAEAKYREAAAAAPGERFHAEMALGHLNLLRERPAEAIVHFDAALAARADEPEALRGLVTALMQTGDAARAAAINDKLASIAPEKAYSAGAITSERLRGEAKELRQERRLAEARARLQAAVDADPTNVWAHHDLANIHLEMGDAASARLALNRLIAVAPDLPEIRIIQTRLLAAEGSWGAALDLLSSVPDAQLDEGTRRWKRELQLRDEIDRILATAGGDRTFARAALQDLQARFQDDPELLVVVAEAWGQLGDAQRAGVAVREVLVRTRHPTAGLKLRLAAVLFHARHEQELVAMLREIAGMPGLSLSEKRDLQALRVGHGVRTADRLREEGAFNRAFSQLSPLVQDYPDDPALLCAVARLYRSAGQDKEAHAVYLRVLREHPARFEARQGAVETAVALQLHAEAERLSLEAVRQSPNDPRAHLLEARRLIAAGEPGAGMDALRRAEALATATTAEALTWSNRSEALEFDSSSSEILRHASLQFTRVAPAEDRAAQQGLLAEIEREIDNLQSRLGVQASAAPRVRVRDGEEGLGLLTAVEVPVTLSIPLGYQSEVELQVTPVSVGNGALPLDQAATVARFGSGAPLGDGPEETTGGTAVQVAWRNDGLRLDVGSTPLGFPVVNVVGGIEWSWRGPGVGLKVDLERRAVTDSVLSWAGTTDPLSGETWGGVVRTGGRVDLGFEQPGSLFYIFGGYHLLTGEKLDDNSFGEAGAGAEWSIHADDVSEVTVGTGLVALTYAKNQRHFTFGHGGYFSPQAFVRAGVPLRWKGAVGKVQWNVLVDPGVNWFREDEVAYFPSDRALQEQLDGSVDGDGNPLPSYYPGQNTVSFSLNAEPRLSLDVSRSMQAGFFADLHTAEDYREVAGGIFLQGTFNGGRRR